MFKSAKSIREKTREIDRSLGKHVERISHFIWPWREKHLLAVVASLAMCDFTSTFALLELSGKKNVYEAGLLAGWALERGGFPFLFAIDIAAVLVLSLAAFTARFLYTRNGQKDYGRAAFVLFLTPYVVIATFAVVNNIILTVR